MGLWVRVCLCASACYAAFSSTGASVELHLDRTDSGSKCDQHEWEKGGEGEQASEHSRNSLWYKTLAEPQASPISPVLASLTKCMESDVWNCRLVFSWHLVHLQHACSMLIMCIGPPLLLSYNDNSHETYISYKEIVWHSNLSNIYLVVSCNSDPPPLHTHAQTHYQALAREWADSSVVWPQGPMLIDRRGSRWHIY